MKALKKLIPESFRMPLRVAKSFLAAAYFGFPAKKLKIIGVTGTSGKSTTVNLIFHVLKENGIKAGVISTIGVIADDKSLETGLHTTTPDPFEFQKYLKFMVKRKVEWVVVEASSHALAQGRIGLTKFDYSVITNIKSDHLDWHGTWENYAISKAKIGLKTKEGGKIIMNRDDKEMYNFIKDFFDEKQKGADILTFSIGELQSLQETYNGSHFTLTGHTFSLPIIGAYNVENALAVINVCSAIGLTYEQIDKAFDTFKGLTGRMQVMNKEPFVVIVDFAHNTDSLRKSLQSARKLVGIGGKLICIFGSAGLRDVEKRFDMGEVSAELADVTIVTAEDPRIESLKMINDQIIEGAERANGKLMKRFSTHADYEAYPDKIKKTERQALYIFDEESIQNRFDAIDLAIKSAEENDVIITEGKGHEKSLCFGTTEYPFTDQDAVKKSLSKYLSENTNQ